MHIKSVTGEKTGENMETCAYSTEYYELLCVRMSLMIMQKFASKRVSTFRWFCKYTKIL
jgi:hypothetical protein